MNYYWSTWDDESGSYLRADEWNWAYIKHEYDDKWTACLWSKDPDDPFHRSADWTPGRVFYSKKEAKEWCESQVIKSMEDWLILVLP